jgi:anti-sigma factor RsiW
MDCGKFQQKVSLLVDGALAAADAQAVSRHLELCPDCRRTYAAMAGLDKDLKAMSLRPHPLLAARVKERIEKQRDRIQEGVLVPLWSKVPLMAMIVLLALGIGNLAGKSLQGILLGSDRGEAVVEMVMPDSGRTLADLVLEFGSEESGQ